MAIETQVSGAALVRISTPSSASGALQDLGYTRNEATVTKEPFFLDVPGDQNGGDDGPPIDIIWLGEIARIRLELTTWDEAVADLVRARTDGSTAGAPVGTNAAGTLMFAGTKTMRLVIASATNPRNFPRCFPRGAIEIGRGTKFSTLICEFEAHKDGSGVLYNASTS